MRDTTQMMYGVTLRAQAIVGFAGVIWLITAVLMTGQHAGFTMFLGVVAGVISLTCLWSFLTPDWLERPTRWSQAPALILAHLVLLMLYSVVALSAGLTAAAGEFGRQLAIIAVSVLAATALLNIINGTRLCFRKPKADMAERAGGVTDIVLPRARVKQDQRPHGPQKRPQPAFSQAS